MGGHRRLEIGHMRFTKVRLKGCLIDPLLSDPQDRWTIQFHGEGVVDAARFCSTLFFHDCNRFLHSSDVLFRTFNYCVDDNQFVLLQSLNQDVIIDLHPCPVNASDAVSKNDQRTGYHRQARDP